MVEAVEEAVLPASGKGPYVLYDTVLYQTCPSLAHSVALLLVQHAFPMDPSEAFHNYTISWGPNRIVWYLDGTPIRVTTRDPAFPWPAKPLVLMVSPCPSSSHNISLNSTVHFSYRFSNDYSTHHQGSRNSRMLAYSTLFCLSLYSTVCSSSITVCTAQGSIWDGSQWTREKADYRPGPISMQMQGFRIAACSLMSPLMPLPACARAGHASGGLPRSALGDRFSHHTPVLQHTRGVPGSPRGILSLGRTKGSPVGSPPSERPIRYTTDGVPGSALGGGSLGHTTGVPGSPLGSQSVGDTPGGGVPTSRIVGYTQGGVPLSDPGKLLAGSRSASHGRLEGYTTVQPWGAELTAEEKEKLTEFVSKNLMMNFGWRKWGAEDAPFDNATAM